jgi:Cu-processing system ATP-binding protein
VTRDTVSRPLEPAPVRITMEGIQKAFDGRTVLAGVDVRFRPGRVTAVLGPNGAGKTTLLKMLLGLVRPDAGRIRIGDRDVSGDPEVRRRVGYMPQLPRFPDNLSGRELAAMLDDVRGHTGPTDDRLLEAFGLLPEWDKPFRTLSGGTRQKLNAALAFRYRPTVLVLDEPTAGLDPVAARILKERVREERREGRTMLLTSHDLLQLQALADDVVFLLDGRVRFAGPVDALLDGTGHGDLEGAIASLLSERRAHPCEASSRTTAPFLDPAARAAGAA